MSLERESLPELTRVAEKLSSVVSQVESTSSNLGGDAGPARLNYVDVTGVERIKRVVEVGRVRERITTRTVPYLQTRLEEVAERIRTSTALNEYTASIAELSAYLKPEELDLVRAEYTSLIGAVPAELAKPPAYTQIFKRKVETTTEVVPAAELTKLTILVDRGKKELEINGKRVKFTDIEWNVLSVIYRKGWLFGATAQEVKQAAAQAGSSADSGSFTVSHIKQKIEADPKNPQIITTDKKARNSRYFWHGEKVDLQFTPSQLVILEGTNQVEVDSRRVELKRPELVLLNALVSKMGQEILTGQLSSDAFGNPNTTETGLRNIFASLAKKINYSWGDQSLVNSGKRGTGAWYKAQNLVVSIKHAEKEPEWVEKPAVPVVDIEAKIAEIQRLVNDGVLTSPEQIARAQEAARQLGGIIEFNKPQVEEPASAEASAGKEETARLKAEARRRNRENREIALNMILDNASGLTPQEIIDLFGRQSNGRRFNWSSAKSSMIVHLLEAEGRLKRYTASEKDRELKSKLSRFMEASEDQDFHEVIKEFEQRLIAWFKGETPLVSANQIDEKVGITDEQAVAEEVRRLREYTPRPRQREIEIIDPEVYAKISNILDQLAEKYITKPISPSQLTRAFPRVKKTDMEKAIEKRYIRPEHGRDHHPAFKPWEVAILIYIRNFGNNLTSSQRSELKEIILEQIQKRETSNGDNK